MSRALLALGLGFVAGGAAMLVVAVVAKLQLRQPPTKSAWCEADDVALWQLIDQAAE